MVNKKQIKQLIGEILNELSLGGAQAESLVYHTGLVESKYQYLMQVKGPAIGFFQCETPTAIDICLHYLKYRTELMKKVSEVTMVDLRYFMDPRPEEWRKLMQYNIALQIAMCRLHYRRVPQALPNNIDEQATYWKKHYNTYKGKGTHQHFLELVETYGE